MATDTQAMGLLIRMMPLMMREFALRIDPMQFFADTGYAASILEAAADAQEPRLRDYASQLHRRMGQLGAGPPGALRSADTLQASDTVPTPLDGAAPAEAPAEAPVPPKKYLRTLR